MARDGAFGVEDWLGALGLERYALAFLANDVDMETLPLLTSEDLLEMGVTSVGHRRRILAAAGPAPAGPSRDAAAPDSVAERRILTVMFVDLVDSTALAAGIDAEDYVEVIARFRAEMAAVVRAFDGHLAQFLGDGIMASFGYPAASDHAAERAVAAALGMVEAGSRLPPVAGRLLRLRVGIATGLTVVGSLAAGATPGDDSALGETPNLAARLQAAAEPGGIVISGSTRELLGDLFDCADLGQRSVRGVAGPLHLWRVIGPSRAATRFEALRDPRRLSPFIGRQAELAALADHLAQARRGKAGALLLSGESGMGKSRLVRQAFDLHRAAAATDGPLVLQCSPYGASVPFHPIRYHLLRACGIAPDDAPAQVEAKVASHVAASGLAPGEAGPLLGMLLSLGAPEPEELKGLGAADIRARQMQVAGDLVAARAAAGRALVIEDATWLDPSSADLILGLLPRLRQAGVAVVATARPGPLPDWLLEGATTALQLDRLAPAEVADLVTALAGPRTLSDEVRDAIVARSDGVPIYAEELARGTLEGTLLHRAGDDVAQVPMTLAESVLARLDRLAHGRKLASVAAAIGREFPIVLLVVVSGLPERTVRDGLAELAAADILGAGRSQFGEAVRFRQNLVRDAAYELLLHRERVPLHARIADTLERDFPGIAGALPHVVAIQRAHAGQWGPARDAWERAGQEGQRRSAYAEAATAFAQAIESNGRLAPGRDRDERELGLRVSLMAAVVCAQGYRSPPAAQESDRILSVCQRLGSATLMLPAFHARWVQLSSAGDARAALALACQARDTAAGSGVAERLISLRMCATSFLFNGRLAEAADHYEEFMSLYHPEEHGDAMRAGHSDHVLMAMLGLAEVSLLRGEVAVADAWRARALAAARASGRLHDLGHVLTFAGCLHSYLLDRIDDAADFAVELARSMRESVLPNWLGHRDLFGGLAAIRRGETAGAGLVREGLAQLKDARALRDWSLILGAEGWLDAGHAPEAEALLDLARPRIELGEERFGAEHHRVMARLLASWGDRAGAARHLDEGLGLARGQGAGLLEARLGRVLEALG